MVSSLMLKHSAVMPEIYIAMCSVTCCQYVETLPLPMHMQPRLQRDMELSKYFKMMACRAWKQYNACLHYDPDNEEMKTSDGRGMLLHQCRLNNAWMQRYALSKVKPDRPPGEPH
jgi:hypothetical protein